MKEVSNVTFPVSFWSVHPGRLRDYRHSSNLTRPQFIFFGGVLLIIGYNKSLRNGNFFVVLIIRRKEDSIRTTLKEETFASSRFFGQIANIKFREKCRRSPFAKVNSREI